MFVTSKRNRNVLVISLLMLGILVGYQNCASSGKAAFTAINTGLEGYDYMIGGVSSTRYVGDSDRFDLRAIGIETLPNIVELDLILPSGQIINASQTTADPSNAFSYTYPTPGDYFYNYSFQVEDHTINYGFKVLVKPRLGTCTEPNDVSLHIVGQGNLNPGVTALYNIEADLDCYTNISAIDWNVLVGETDVYSGTDSDLDFIYTFNQANTYTVIAKLSAQRLGQEPIQNITLQKTVVVGTSTGSCDPN